MATSELIRSPCWRSAHEHCAPLGSVQCDSHWHRVGRLSAAMILVFFAVRSLGRWTACGTPHGGAVVRTRLRSARMSMSTIQRALGHHRRPAPAGGLLRAGLQRGHHHVIDLLDGHCARPVRAGVVPQSVEAPGREPGPLRAQRRRGASRRATATLLSPFSQDSTLLPCRAKDCGPFSCRNRLSNWARPSVRT